MMAATRCVNRATRFAVGAPLSHKDELPGGKDDSNVAAEGTCRTSQSANGQTQWPDPEFDGQWIFQKETKEIVTGTVCRQSTTGKRITLTSRC